MWLFPVHWRFIDELQFLMASASRIESFVMFGPCCRIIVFSTMLARVSFWLCTVVECCWGPPLARCMVMRRERVFLIVLCRILYEVHSLHGGKYSNKQCGFFSVLVLWGRDRFLKAVERCYAAGRKWWILFYCWGHNFLHCLGLFYEWCARRFYMHENKTGQKRSCSP